MRLIDADDLHVDYLFPSTTTMTKCYEYVSKAQINNAPTIEAVPVVHGRNTDESRLFHCSECGYGVFDAYLDDEKNYNYEYHYCPWCGAKMEGAEDAGRNNINS